MEKRCPPALLWLAGALLCLLAGGWATLALSVQAPAANAALKADAAARMEACMEAVRGYKAQEGLALSPEDRFGTGLLGDRLTGLTTTLGILEAKRTAASSEMAALAVQLLQEAGVQPGDRVAAGCSGSFPSLDLALLCACDAMGVECRYIPSIGASSYGANQPELTFAEMACRLADDGLIAAYPLAVSAGGQGDLGLDMDQAALQSVWEQLAPWGLTVIAEENYAQNLALREALYEQQGPIACFVGVGGSIVTSGRGNAQLGQGVINSAKVGPITDQSGLLERYCARGVPAIQLLNVKQLAADYDLPYDPETPVPTGQSALYHTTARPRLPALLGLAAALGCLWGCRVAQRRAASRKGECP